MNHDDFCWSTDEEDFSLDFCTALDQIMGDLAEEESGVGRILWFGEAVKPEITSIINVDDILDMMHDRASDICGEHAEDFPNVGAAAMKEMRDFLDSWCERHLAISFFAVKNAKEYIITEQDVLDYES